MRKTLKFLIASGACLVMAGTGQMSAQAAMNLETDAPVAGASVAINNYYASSLNPEKELAEAFASKEVLAVAGAGQTGVAGYTEMLRYTLYQDSNVLTLSVTASGEIRNVQESTGLEELLGENWLEDLVTGSYEIPAQRADFLKTYIPEAAQ